MSRTRLLNGSCKKRRISSGAKAHLFRTFYGTAEAVPSSANLMRVVSVVPAAPIEVVVMIMVIVMSFANYAVDGEASEMFNRGSARLERHRHV